MKKEQGVTLISLIVYVILMTFIVAGISSITASFYSNVNDYDKNSESAVAYAKFNMYFLADIKKKNAKIESVGDNYIIISYEKKENGSGTGEIVKVEYSMQNNALYRDKVKICDNVKDVLIVADKTKNTIKIEMLIGDYQKTTTYKLENIDTENDEGPTI